MKRYNSKIKEARYMEIKYADSKGKIKSLEVLDNSDLEDDSIRIMFKHLSFPDNTIFLSKKDAKTLCKQIMQLTK